MVEGDDSRRGFANRASSCGCCGHGYGNQSRHHSVNGRPGADTYDSRSSLSNSQPNSQPDSHRHAYAYASTYAYAYAYAYASAYAYPSAHAYADADAHAHAHAHPYARLQRTIPKLGVAILR